MADETRVGSPSRVSGKVFRKVEILGVEYTLTEPQKIGVFAEKEAIILARRLDPVSMGMRAIDRLPANRHAAVWEGCANAASRGIATQEEWAAFDGSLWDPAFRFWMALSPKDRANRDTLTGVTWAVELVHAMDLKKFREVMAAVDSVSQDKDIKNSDGPTETSGQ